MLLGAICGLSNAKPCLQAGGEGGKLSPDGMQTILVRRLVLEMYPLSAIYSVHA